MGHLVKDGLIYPNDEKGEVIRNWPTPKTRRQLKSFLGLTGYFRDHIHNYATIAYRLTETLQQHAFESLQRALISKPVLRPTDPLKKIT